MQAPDAAYYQTIGRNLFLNKSFFEILDIFSKKNIPVIPLKGIALIQNIIGMGGRYIGDIDILLKAEDVPRGINALLELGYSGNRSYFNPAKPYSMYLNSLALSKPSEIPYFIHLHWHILNTTLPLFMYDIDMSEIWREARKERCSYGEILVMAPRHLIVYLAIHAFNHSFSKPNLKMEIKATLRFYKDKSIEGLVHETAKAWKAELPLRYAIMADMLSGSHNSVYPLYIGMTGGLFKKIRFIFLSLFPPPGVMRRIYAQDTAYNLFLSYIKRLVWGVSQFAVYIKKYLVMGKASLKFGAPESEFKYKKA